MMNRLFVVLCVITLSACSSDGEERPEYLDSYSIQALEVPPTLTSPDTAQQLELPEPSREALEKLGQREQASVQGSVVPLFEGLELKSEQGMYWLEVNQDPGTVWSVLKDFWAHEGIMLERQEPLLGLMETEWLKEYKPGGEESVMSRVFSKLSPDRLDKFRMRVERVRDAVRSKIFISHEGLEVFVADAGGSSWRHRPADPMMEYEMLRRLVLYAGLTELQADEIFTGYQPFQPRIRTIDDSKDLYALSGDLDFVWHRVLKALDRLGVEVTEQNRSDGRFQVVVSNVPEELTSGNEDELNESSWLVQVFTGGPGEEQLEQGQVTIDITLQGQDSTTEMQLSHVGEPLPKIGLAARFEEALVKVLQ